MSPNLSAFLSAISHAEGTDRSTEPYRVCYGYGHTIANFANHPTLTGEWMGELITMGKYAGERSTAAGRYQINAPTWKRAKQAIYLPDFTPDCQDRCAAWLISEDGALSLVNGGQVADAIEKCHQTWASFPGNDSGQPQASMARLIEVYGDAGGAFA
jgi:muramidase (phage lysozyme)